MPEDWNVRDVVITPPFSNIVYENDVQFVVELNKLQIRAGKPEHIDCDRDLPKMDISLDSLRAMLAFIEQTPDVRLPQISLTAGGDVYLCWKSEPGRLFSIHFLDDRRVRFAIFYPNSRHEQMINRHSGYETVDTVLRSVDKISSVRDWISG